MITTLPPSSDRVDVLVVGARCAGAATAMLLAQRGARVLVLERGPLGADTLSTHALMRGAVVQLARWGVLQRVVAAGTPPVRRTTFHYAGDVVAVDIAAKHGAEALYAPRRTVLDRLLADAAMDAGADVRHGWRVQAPLTDQHGRVVGVSVVDPDGRESRVTASTVVGADGRHSTIARVVGAAVERVGRATTATLYGHWPGLAVDGYRWMYDERLSAGAIPTNGGACVFVTVPAAVFPDLLRRGSEVAFHDVLGRLAPDLDAETRNVRPESPLKGFGGQAGFMRRGHGPGWALTGDAAYFKDPLTAHGITDALLHAELLADALGVGTEAALDRYERVRRALAQPVFDATEAIASFDWDIDTLKRHHTTLSRAMSREIDEALAAFRQAPLDLGAPAFGDDDRRLPARRVRLVEHEQETLAVG